MLAEGSRQGHFFGFALYLDRSRDARPLPRGFTGHVAHPLRSILHRRLPGALLCAALSPRPPVIGHVLLRGHARNGAADRFSPKRYRRLPETNSHSLWPPAVKFAPCE